ncbi:MAG TPA: molybdenum cofactor biosynthesis protein MoaE [Gemmatimonadaceae bacterium]|nr:molybdenum cofactor biosynthesis protein MoaE [Gemmatimonadaceae bacterium]
MIRSALVRTGIDSARLIAEVSAAENGAAVLFLGTVRSRNDGRDVLMIEYSAYEPMAEKEIDAILHEAADQFGVHCLVAEHRLGELRIGETSVAIAAAHPHRAPALDALRYSIEQLKLRAPIWKLEHYADGDRNWVSAAEGKRA